MHPPLIACHECDTLHRKVALPAGSVARCTRCDGVLYRHSPTRLGYYLSLVSTALIVFVMANSFPIISLELQGNVHGSTLPGAILALHALGMNLVAVLVFVTTLLVPLLQLALLLWVLLCLLWRRVPETVHVLLYWLHLLRPWGMVDVFLMAVLVALVKLQSTAEVIPGIALWAFAAMAFLMAAVAMIDPRDLWDRVSALSEPS